MPMRNKHIDQQMEQFTAACKTAGLKITHQRTLIYRELLILPDHPSAEALHKRITKTTPSISLDTVYRTLATLEQHGLVNRIQTAESQARFEAALSSHHHLICSTCKSVLDLQWPQFDTIPLPDQIQTWGSVQTRNAVMYGTCNRCTP